MDGRSRFDWSRVMHFMAVGGAALLALCFAVAAGYGFSNGFRRLDPRGLSGCDSPLAGLRGGRMSCFNKALGHMVNDDAAMGLREVIRYTAISSPWFQTNCHLMMHSLGRTYGRRADLNTVMALPPNDCVGGFIHGILEIAATEFTADDLPSVKRLCHSRVTWRQTECEHGVGHAVMRDVDNDVARAVDRCDVRLDSEFSRNCFDGIFMENMFAYQRVDESRRRYTFDADDPGRHCRPFAYAAADVCFAWAVKFVPAPRRVPFCTHLRASYTANCLRSIGVMRPDDARSVCRELEECWYGVGFVTAVTLYEAKDEQRLCSGLGARPRRGCARGVGLAAALLGEPNTGCSHLPSGSRISCSEEIRNAGSSRISSIGFL